jgi:hypothetical protein
MTARTRGAPLDATAAVGAAQAAPFHHDRDLAESPLCHATIQAGAAVGAHAPFDLMTSLRVVLHGTNL